VGLVDLNERKYGIFEVAEAPKSMNSGHREERLLMPVSELCKTLISGYLEAFSLFVSQDNLYLDHHRQ